jgi:hypothetical protein
MPVRQAVATLFAILVLASAWAPSAGAHESSDAVPTGIIKVHAGASVSLPIEAINPRDTLQWIWAVVSGSPAALTTHLFWTDASGREHAVEPDQAGRTFGTFIAPADLAGARLVWRNMGDSSAEIQWSYGCSADFWRRPDMYLPALTPVLLLIGAQILGKAIDARGRRRRPQPLGSTIEEASNHLSPQGEEGTS